MLRNPLGKRPDGLEDWLVSPRGPIRRERVPPNEAFSRWEMHRSRFAETGLWPVIVPVEHIENLERSFNEEAAGVEDHLAMGLNLDVGDYFSGALAGHLEYDEEGEIDLDFDPAELIREDKPPAFLQIAATDDLLKSNSSQLGLWIALVPCREPWEVPAALGYGGWNACPMPAEHIAVLREWHARHGAVPLVVSFDTIELLVRPVEDLSEAKRIAIEQFAYCSDIVDQGIGTVEALASSLLSASVWFFWWD